MTGMMVAGIFGVPWAVVGLILLLAVMVGLLAAACTTEDPDNDGWGS